MSELVKGLKRIQVTEYDVCIALSGKRSKGDCKKELRQRIQKAKSLIKSRKDINSDNLLEGVGRIDEKRIQEIALIIKSLGIKQTNVLSFQEQYPSLFKDLEQLLNRVDSVGLAVDFTAITDPMQKGSAIVFDPNVSISKDNRDCSVSLEIKMNVCKKEPCGVKWVLAQDNLSDDLKQELSAWMTRGASICFSLAEGIRHSSIVPDTNPKINPIQIKKRKRKIPKFQDKRNYCNLNFPHNAGAVWNKARYNISENELDGFSGKRCGYHEKYEKHTKWSKIKFTKQGRMKMHIKLKGKWETYILNKTRDGWRGMHENPVKWIIPKGESIGGFKGPNGNWGPAHIRALDKDTLLLYFEMPIKDFGKKYYAYCWVKREL